ncbi:YitT family protein [Streptococcus fryi]
MPETYDLQLRKFILIALGAAIYAFGFVVFKLPNNIAESGMAGVTLILHALFGVNPAIAGYLINFPLIVLGAFMFGRKAMLYTIFGTFSLYFFVWVFQQTGLMIDLQGDYFVIAILAGLTGGIGGGIVFRNSGTIGGSDIIARLFEEKFSIPLVQGLLGIDIIVMLLSLTYVSIPQMMYALVASFIYSQVVGLVQRGGYSVRELLVITNHSDEIAREIMQQLGRGVTYLQGSGAYSGNDKKILYVVLNPSEIKMAKSLVMSIDDKAFISISTVDEIVSPEFVIKRSKYRQVS